MKGEIDNTNLQHEIPTLIKVGWMSNTKLQHKSIVNQETFTLLE